MFGKESGTNYREVLTGLYNEILEVSKGMPEHAFYRQHLEQDAKAHLAVLETATDVLDLEAKIGLGQAEELIEMAKDELKLVDFYYENKMWDMVVEEQKEADKKVLEMADVLYFTDPDNHPAILTSADRTITDIETIFSKSG
jgi:hypothetical protein